MTLPILTPAEAASLGEVTALRLETRKGRQIDNIRPSPRSPAADQAAVDFFKREGRTLRSTDSTYNCMGMVFAARRTAIDPQLFDFIVAQDGYRPVAPGDPGMPGDVIAYRAHDNAIVHVGRVVGVALLVDNPSPGAGLTILSKWGRDGEYIHAADDLPDAYNLPTRPKIEVWTDRT